MATDSRNDSAGTLETVERRAGRSSGPFVGRARELLDLRGDLAAAVSGRGRAVMLVGEAGIGKTRLAEELAEHATAAGAAVLWGRCWEGGGAPAYWPWVQVIRAYARQSDAATLSTNMGAGASYIARLIPELRGLLGALPDVPELSSIDPERALFYLFDAATTFFRNAAAAQPLVLVLDDLHAADHASLLLLLFLARELRDTRVLVIGCYRAPELSRHPDHARLLGTVAQEGRLLSLAGLTEREVAAFMEGAFGRVPSGPVVGAVHQATGGNPFFLDEVRRLLVAGGRARRLDAAVVGRLGIPDGVRVAIRHRLAPLSDDCVTALGIAAVLGREFDVAALQRAAGLPVARLLEGLGEARAAGIVRWLAPSVGRYSFAHALIRDTLYDDLTPVRRAHLHLRIAEALEALYRADPEPHLAELAHHFCAAVPGGDPEKAVDYAVRAARRAFGLLAYDEAAAQYERALHVLGLTEPENERHCELVLALGDALDRVGEEERATEAFRRAARIARGLGRPVLLARAALGIGSQWALKFTSTVVDRSDAGLLEEALVALPSGDSALRARLLSRLGLNRRFSSRPEIGRSLSQEAVEMARRVGDTGTLAYALVARHAALLGPDHLEARLAVADEVTRLARAAGDRDLALRGHALRAFDLHEMGEMEAADRETDIHVRLATELRDPFDLWISTLFRAMRAIMQGRAAEGDRLAHEALAVARRLPGQQATDENAGLCFAGQMALLCEQRGRMEECLSALGGLAERLSGFQNTRALYAMLCVAAGREADARGQLEFLARDRFGALPKDTLWLSALCFLAIVCSRLRDRSRAAILYEVLLPYAGRHATVATPGSVGSTSRYLGLLAGTMCRWDEAVHHFEAAIAMNERMGAWPFAAHAREEYASVLLARAAPGDRDRALALLAQALDAARQLGILPLAERVLDVRRRAERAVPGAGGRPVAARPGGEDAPAREGPQEAVFRRDGEYWTVAYAGIVSRLRHTKGLAYLAYLLRHPRWNLHALELATEAEGCPQEALASTERIGGEQLAEVDLRIGRLEHAGPLLDRAAQASYVRRLAELRAVMDEAKESRDPVREAGAEREIRFLEAELARAVGMRGRHRPGGSATERARLNVTRAILRALDRIGRSNAPLAYHLRRSLRTGIYSSYAPDSGENAVWRFSDGDQDGRGTVVPPV